MGNKEVWVGDTCASVHMCTYLDGVYDPSKGVGGSNSGSPFFDLFGVKSKGPSDTLEAAEDGRIGDSFDAAERLFLESAS